MTAWDTPGPRREFTRRPFDEALEEWAERNSRPCWAVTNERLAGSVAGEGGPAPLDSRRQRTPITEGPPPPATHHEGEVA